MSGVENPKLPTPISSADSLPFAVTNPPSINIFSFDPLSPAPIPEAPPLPSAQFGQINSPFCFFS